MTFPIFCLMIFALIMVVVAFVAMAMASGTSFKANKQVALSYDLSKAVAAHTARMRCSLSHTQRMDTEFRRWFVAAAASPVLIGMTSTAVDEYWHTLLDVDAGRLYREFSEAVAGHQVRHVEGVGSDDLAARGWVAYETIWKVSPPQDLFPRPSEHAIERYRKHVRDYSSGSSDGGDSSSAILTTLDFGSSCSSHGGSHGSHGDGGHSDGGSHGGDGGGGDGGGGDGGGGCGGGGE